MNEKNSGIYSITTIHNNMIYYGSTKCFKSRWVSHKSRLLLNKHKNIHMQNTYNKYGISDFSFEVVMYCEEKDLLFYEQRFLDTYWDGGKTCYNICKNAKSPMAGRKSTEQSRQNMSLAQKGKIISQEQKDKISIAVKEYYRLKKVA
jgi:group I intron endonuclease